MGWADTFTFDQSIQEAINRRYVATQDKYTAETLQPFVGTIQALAATDADNAEKAADKALSLTETLESENATVAELEAWYNETKTAATAAEEKVANGRKAIEDAKREQQRAKHEAEIEQQRLADREHLSGITKDLDGSDAAINALKENAKAARLQAEAAKMQNQTLTGATAVDDSLEKAMHGLETPSKESLEEKLARLSG